MTGEVARREVEAAKAKHVRARKQREAVEAELRALDEQAKAANVEDVKAFQRLAAEKASAKERLETLRDREADAQEDVKAAEAALHRAEAAERMERAQETRRAALEDAEAVTAWLRDEIGPAIRSRLERHKALTRDAWVAARAVGQEGPHTLWRDAPVDSEVWEGAGERVRAAARAAQARADRIAEERRDREHRTWAETRRGFALPSDRARPVVVGEGIDSAGVAMEYEPLRDGQ